MSLLTRSLRIGVTLAGVSMLVHGIDGPHLVSALAGADRLLLVAAVVLGALSQLAEVVPWGLLLRADHHIGWRELTGVCLRATFIGQTLPMGVGGDAVRMVEVGRRAGYGTVLASITMSRLLGLGAMVVGALAGTLLVPSLRPLSGLAAAAAVVVAVLTALSLNADRLTPPRRPRIRRLSRAEWLGEMRRRLAGYRGRPATTAAAAAATLAGSALSLLSMVLFGHALGAAVGWPAIAAAVPVSLIATMIPFAVNGIGVREGILVGILMRTGVAAVPAAGIALFADLQALPVAAVGAVSWLLRARRAPRVAAPAMRRTAAVPRAAAA